MRTATVSLLVLVLIFPLGEASSSASFLNGVNQAWVDYGADFGNSPSPSVMLAYNQSFDAIRSAAGGNSSTTETAIRIWVHCGGENTPIFNSEGVVTATDRTGTFISDIVALLEAAASRGVQKVYLCLWNLAVTPTPQLVGLIGNATLLDSYFNVVLIPLLKQISTQPSFAGIDIVNEPEGSVAITGSDNPCLNTQLFGSGAGWTGLGLSMADVQAFVARHSSVLRAMTPTAERTVGSWNARALTNAMPGAANFWQDSCLLPFGSPLSIYQVHSYADSNGVFDQYSPFLHQYQDYQLDKPLIVGEFSAVSTLGKWTPPQMYKYLACNGYTGGWGWQENGSGFDSDSPSELYSGMASLRDLSC